LIEIRFAIINKIFNVAFVT